MKTVAALYVDPRGPYPTLPWVDCWDASRDARRYAGPLPVVDHPPCAPWSASLSGLSNREHERSCGPIALAQVRRFGGVLEHPAHSRLFRELELPIPIANDRWIPLADKFGGFSIEVQQVDWGHVARKRTWLYIVGVPRAAVVLPHVHRDPTHWCSGGHQTKRPPPKGVKIASAKMRRTTPILFARWLVYLAESAHAPMSSAAVEQWGAMSP